jgi:hypothetical protein
MKYGKVDCWRQYGGGKFFFLKARREERFMINVVQSDLVIEG